MAATHPAKVTNATDVLSPALAPIGADGDAVAAESLVADAAGMLDADAAGLLVAGAAVPLDAGVPATGLYVNFCQSNNNEHPRSVRALRHAQFFQNK